jgi:hypothetical protein
MCGVALCPHVSYSPSSYSSDLWAMLFCFRGEYRWVFQLSAGAEGVPYCLV